MIHIVGDVSFADGYFDTGWGMGSQIKKGLNPFQHLVFSVEDLWMGNLECVVSAQSVKRGLQKKQFLIEPSYLAAISHLNLYSVANNHVMQHGKPAYIGMLKYIEASGSQYVGSKDRRSIKVKHNNYRVGIVSFSQHDERFTDVPEYWYQPEYSDILKQYAEIAECEIRIAYIHWGCEFINYPYFDQRQFARWLVDIGFNLVVGVHSHVLQGYEKYKEGFIFYSLGNFLFNMPSLDTRHSVILHVDFRETLSVDYDYVLIDNRNLPIFLEKQDVPEKYSFPYLNHKLDQPKENEVYFKELFHKVANHRKANMFFICKSLFRYTIKDLLAILHDFIRRRVLR